jgi:hypothetical protein
MNNTTTTDYLQKKPDFFTDAKQCIDSERKNINTNTRYKNFEQTHFTAGDIEQFEKYRDPTNGILSLPNINFSKNIFSDIDIGKDNLNWNKYKNIDSNAVLNTFEYMFNKFKKGIFLKIKHGELKVFLPFSKKKFINEWADKIQIDPKYGNLNNFIKHVQESQGRNFNEKYLNKFVNNWYSNNCLVRYEFPIREGDTNNAIASDMFRTLCRERKLPDMEFFVNRRDFPMIKKDGTEPYEDLFGSEKQKLISYSFDQYVPILSMVSRENFADLPIPTGDDWSRVSRKEGKYFPDTCSRVFELSMIPWEERKNIAVFRGASTGCGVDIKTNPRLNLAYISSQKQIDKGDGLPYLDAGITDWNMRPRKLINEKYLKTIDKNSLPFQSVPKMTPQEQNEYKYIINVDGHVSAFRLGLELEYGWCILLVDSKYKMWFSQFLEPFVHYIPVKSDLSDLIEQIKWCKQNDNKCKIIAQNAIIFAKKYLCKDGILDYLQKLLYEIKSTNGFYIYSSLTIRQVQLNDEMKILNKQLKKYPTITKNIDNFGEFPSYMRTSNYFQGVQWTINKLLNESTFSKAITTKRKSFENKNSEILEYTLGNVELIEKIGNDSLYHECFIAQKQMNKMLEQIPNFSYIFSVYENLEHSNKHLVMENIRGETFGTYLHSSNFNMKEYLFILLQTALAIDYSQKKCNFIHYDLAPWNIIIQRNTNTSTIEYPLGLGNVWSVKTNTVPIIIDYERSHIIYNKKHYSFINDFEDNKFQDIITLLITSLSEIINLRLTNSELADVLTLANFITETDFRQHPFIGKDGFYDLKSFLYKNRNYSQLLELNKYKLQSKTPEAFIKYILSNFKYSFPIEQKKSIKNYFDNGNSTQVFEYSFSETIDEKINTYLNVPRRLLKCNLPKCSNIFLDYYTSQILIDNISSCENIFLEFQKNIKNQNDYSSEFNNAYNIINTTYLTDFKEETKIEYNFPKIDKFILSENDFLYPEKILKILELNKNIKINIDITEYKQIIEYVLLKMGPNKKYVISSKVYKYYKNNFSDMFNIDITEYRNSLANLNSLRYLSYIILSKTVKDINRPQNIVKNTYINKYIKNSNKIISLLE